MDNFIIHNKIFQIKPRFHQNLMELTGTQVVRTENEILCDLTIYKVVCEMKDGTQYDMRVNGLSCRM